MRDIVKNENVAEQIVDHQMMSYHPLQVVTSESVLAGPQERNGLCNAAQNSVFASLSFLPGVTSHNIQAIDQAQNGILVNNGISTSATAYVGTNENMTPTLYVQTENGNYQVNVEKFFFSNFENYFLLMKSKFKKKKVIMCII